MQQRPYWGDPRPASITPKQLYGLNFSVEAGAKFEFWIDDLEFLLAVNAVAIVFCGLGCS